MTRIIMSIAAAVFAASITTVAIAGFGDNDRANVSKITPFHACEVTYINNPRPHWCDRKGHVHWR